MPNKWIGNGCSSWQIFVLVSFSQMFILVTQIITEVKKLQCSFVAKVNPLFVGIRCYIEILYFTATINSWTRVGFICLPCFFLFIHKREIFLNYEDMDISCVKNSARLTRWLCSLHKFSRVPTLTCLPGVSTGSFAVPVAHHGDRTKRMS